MAREIEKAAVDTFTQTFELLPMQMKSLLESRVRTEAKPGERAWFSQIGNVAARQRLARGTDTPNMELTQFRRWVSMVSFELGTVVDWEDIIDILTDPSQEFQKAFVAALNREQDYTIVNTGMLGTTYTGKAGTTAETFPSATMDIAHGSAGFTLAKVEEAYTKLVQNVPIPVGEMPELHIGWTRKQEQQFLGTTEVKSVDYNTQKVLVKGTLAGQEFYGFNYVRLEDWADEAGTVHRILPYAAGSPNVRTCVAWLKDGIILNDQRKPEVTVAPRPDKSFNPGIYAKSRHGACRAYTNAACKINCTET